MRCITRSWRPREKRKKGPWRSTAEKTSPASNSAKSPSTRTRSTVGFATAAPVTAAAVQGGSESIGYVYQIRQFGHAVKV